MASTTNEVRRLRGRIAELEKALAAQVKMPELPPAGRHGRPALKTIDVLMARKLITLRLAAGLTQAELADRAGVRVETICRLETAKNSPNVRTVQKIEMALAGPTTRGSKQIGKSHGSRRPTRKRR
jgi:DNA-binding XRE family transcriptional regulator